MRYLLDTNVISALRTPDRHLSVAQWAASVSVLDQFVAAMSVAEIERGVVSKERQDPHQGAVLRHWFTHAVLPTFTNRVLAFDIEAARILANYRVPEHAPYDDALIGAVAQANNMMVVTRNIKHFEPLGVSCFDPWDEN
ncbi:hypothetical protein SAMN06309944_0547 [Micrococcales bacterium KH10]|nr:hypothetical protein SAMN06309944_0547 [Micrococcales bacterium KH10]